MWSSRTWSVRKPGFTAEPAHLPRRKSKGSRAKALAAFGQSPNPACCSMFAKASEQPHTAALDAQLDSADVGRRCLYAARRFARLGLLGGRWGAAPNPAQGTLSLGNPGCAFGGCFGARLIAAARRFARFGFLAGDVGALPQTLPKGHCPLGIPVVAFRDACLPSTAALAPALSQSAEGFAPQAAHSRLP